jgi:hypothetical protein
MERNSNSEKELREFTEEEGELEYYNYIYCATDAKAVEF